MTFLERDLLEQINQLREERDAYKKHAEDFETLYLQEHRAKNSSNRENAKLVKALEWIANGRMYGIEAAECARRAISDLRGREEQ